MIELPAIIVNSQFLNGQQLQQLASVEVLPAVDPAYDDNMLQNIFQYYSLTPDEMDDELHRYAAQLLTQGKVNEAWQVLLSTTIL